MISKDWLRFDDLVDDMSDEDRELCEMYHANDMMMVFGNTFGADYRSTL